LEEMDSAAAAQEMNYTWYDWWVESIAGWLPELRWVYIPLKFEDTPFSRPFTIFAARRGEDALVQAVKAALTADDFHTFELVVTGDEVFCPADEAGPYYWEVEGPDCHRAGPES